MFLKKIFGKRQDIADEKPNVTRKSFYSSILSYPDFEKIDDFNQIVPVFEYVFNSNSQIALRAAAIIHRFLNKATLFKNNELYETFRYLRIGKSDIENSASSRLKLKPVYCALHQ